MEGLAAETQRGAPFGLDRDVIPQTRVLYRLGSRRNVGRGVMMIVVHDVGNLYESVVVSRVQYWKLKLVFDGGLQRMP